MKYTTPQSLLALPATASNPSAYQILGLPDFEPDRIRIRTAGEVLAAKLGEMQGDADADAWAQANRWLRSATTILSDASKKSAYDRKLMASRPAAAVDPLAGMLPGRAPSPSAMAASSGPAATMSPAATMGGPGSGLPLPSAVPGRPQAVGQSSPVPAVPGQTPYGGEPAFGMGALAGGGMTATEPGEAGLAGAPVIKRKVTSGRKKSLPIVPLVMIAFCIGCIGALGYVAYAMVNGDQAISLTINRGPAVNVVDPNGDGKAVVVPGEVGDRTRVPFDPVMGGLGDRMQPPAGHTPVDENNQDAMRPQNQGTPTTGTSTAGMAPDSTAAMPEMNSDASPTPKPEMDPTMSVPATPTPTPEPVPEEPMKPSPEEIKAADQAIAAVRAAALGYQWDKLKPLSEAAETAAQTPEQKDLAQGLAQLMDLGTYYRDGIFKTMQSLQNGQEIDLKEGFKFVIVEITPQQLVIRLNGANKTYRLDALPPPLVNRFGEMAMPDDSATSRAAKYAYQALAESTNAPFRQKAVQELSQIDEEIEGAEVEQLLAAIQFLYPQ